MVDAFATIGVFAFGMLCVSLFADFCLKNAAKEEKKRVD